MSPSLSGNDRHKQIKKLRDMRKDVLGIILDSMSKEEVANALTRVLDYDNSYACDAKMEWILGLYPSVSLEWIASHEEDIRRWVTDNVQNVKDMKTGTVTSPWDDITVKVLITEDLNVNEDQIEQYDEAYGEVFEGITADNAQKKIDTFYGVLKERGISYSWYGRKDGKKKPVYALRTVTVDRDYINFLKAVPL